MESDVFSIEIAVTHSPCQYSIMIVKHQNDSSVMISMSDIKSERDLWE